MWRSNVRYVFVTMGGCCWAVDFGRRVYWCHLTTRSKGATNGAPGLRSKKLLGAPGIAIRSKKLQLLEAKGIATRSNIRY